MRTLKILLIIAAISLTAACTRPDYAREVLEKNGYTSIHMNGHGWFACSQDDAYADSFTATNANGHVVKGVVCSAWFKGSTIRFN